MTPALRIVVLVSGRGSNLQAVIEAVGRGQLRAQVVGVFSDRRRAPALQHAEHAGIPALAIQPRAFPNRPDHDAALFAAIDALQPDLIVCAGYMRLLGDAVVASHRGRIINIHPSLLPAYKGLHTHQQALDDAAADHGASVHFVTGELDGGPVIAQAVVPVMPGDDAERLAERVLQREHPLLVASLQCFADRRLALVDDRILLDGKPLQAPLQLDSDNRLHPPAPLPDELPR